MLCINEQMREEKKVELFNWQRKSAFKRFSLFGLLLLCCTNEQYFFAVLFSISFFYALFSGMIWRKKRQQ
jgi:hypothetical protein